jgi:hypothetical protein
VTEVDDVLHLDNEGAVKAMADSILHEGYPTGWDDTSLMVVVDNVRTSED